jgi:FAD/FMN-containing dehydrogenase
MSQGKSMGDDKGAVKGGQTRRQVIKWAGGTAALMCTDLALADAASAPPRAADWSALRQSLNGRTLVAGDGDYEALRLAMVWNGRKPARRPDVIVRTSNTADVVKAVRFARQHHLKVAVRGGGHHYNGTVLRQGGMLLDLSGLAEIQLDGPRRQAAVQPGVVGSDFQARLGALGLAFPVGHCADVRMSGFMLNGGIGWNAFAWGPGCANVTSVEIVDADGNVITADDRQHADLFWAARGAGPGFPGIVTRWHLRLHSLPKAIHTTTVCFALEDTEVAMEWIMQGVARLPLQSDLFCVAPVPQDLRSLIGLSHEHALAFVVTVFAESEAQARQWLKPFATPAHGISPLLSDQCRHTPFQSLFALINAAFPSGHRLRADDMHLSATPKLTVSMLRESIRSAPGPHSNVQLFWSAPLPADMGTLPEMALYTPAEAAYVGIYGFTDDPAQDWKVDEWVRAARDALRAYDLGSYVGEADLSSGVGRARQCFTPQAWTRLASIRHKYDPEGRFVTFADYGS